MQLCPIGKNEKQSSSPAVKQTEHDLFWDIVSLGGWGIEVAEQFTQAKKLKKRL